MSAYALPGLLPPLSFDGTKVVASSSSLFDIVSFDFSCMSTEEKVAESPCSSSTCSRSTPEVHVLSAKIDTLALVRLLTSKKQKVGKLPRGIVRRRAVTVGRTNDRYQRNNSNSRECTNDENSGLESAMQFELSVDVDGETFCTCRSLAEIRQLRRELLCENDEIMYNVVSSSSSSSNKSMTQMEQQHHLHRIPELPELVEGSCVTNFGLLNDTLHEHSPVLEAWFADVLNFVGSLDNSPCLRNFLCEPSILSLYQSTVPFRQTLQRFESAPGRLESILEDSKQECDRDD